nr:hypothetical protein [bacterium]
SGAAALYKMEALEDVAYINEANQKEYFDELMFMYKEDVDLAYRLQLAGYKSIYTPLAVAYHDRSVNRIGKGIWGIIKGRLGRRKEYKEWSWLNHHIILEKMSGLDYSLDTKWKTRWFGFKSFVYVLFAEPYVLKQWWQLWKMRGEIAKRREQLKKRVDVKKHLEKLM